ncbi:MAG: hypothetical protein Q9183_002783 [Haloplaca sp. 2 TL-2023]
MTHDGAHAVPLENDVRITNDETQDIDFIRKQEFRRRLIFRATIFRFIDLGYNVALIDGLEWLDTKIMTQVVEGTKKAKTIPFLDDKCFTPKVITEYTYEQCSGLACKASEDDAQSLLHEALGDYEVTERVLLTLVTLSAISKSNRLDPQMVLASLIQMILITDTGLTSRRLDLPALDKGKQNEINGFLSTFARTSHRVLQELFWKDLCKDNSLQCDVVDLIDGRLFINIWVRLESVPLDQILSPRLRKKLEGFGKILSTPLSLSRQVSSSPSLDQSVDMAANPSSQQRIAILSFSHSVFDQHMKPISITVRPSREPTGKSAKVFREVSHWHNAKKRLDPKAGQTLSERDKARALRRNQFFMAEMISYAASLTGVTGGSLDPELITVSEDTKAAKDPERAKENRIPTKQQKGQASTKGASSKKSIIAANVAAKEGKAAESAIGSWEKVRLALDAERLQSRYRKTKTYLRDLKDEKKEILEAEVTFYMLCTLLKVYRILGKSTDRQAIHQIDGVTALLFSTMRSIPTARGLTKTIVDNVKLITKALKLPDPGLPSVEMDRKLAFDPDLHLSELKSIGSSYHEFQLLHYGPYMDRNLDSAPDSRVKSFNPDGWQRKVLDELDAERSIFVVAPTSAGKTFISFYAMERILRRNDDSVLVYVAPTKALVNQIGAEIQARFKKQYKYAGKSVWAIHTRDYRINNPAGCQILVTVPHILQIMLLSSSNAKSWSKKIRCIIFDEIHCIGQAEDGVVWEQLLLLAPCPIIALSATVGNPEQFNSWLTSTQRSSGFDLTMITHQHRYSDLRKFIYSPPKKFIFNGLPERSFATLGLDGLEGLAFVHPVASLVNKSRGMPQDLSLEARDCLMLWNTMCRYQTPDFPVDEGLDPRRLPQIIRKVDIIEWEKNLKALLKAWMQQDESPFDKVVEELSKPIEDIKRPQSYTSQEGDDPATTEAMSIEEDDLYQSTLPLLCKLQQRDALPAILFNYDRAKCEGICKVIMMQLKKAEAAYKEASSAWKAKVRGYEQYLKDKKKQNPTKAAAAKKKGKLNDDEGTSKADRMQDAASSEANPYENFDPDAAVTGFHFANVAKATKDELAAIHKELTWRGLQPWLMESLTRGIGVHHAGMNRKYRQAVEMLFRKGFLRVVIATGTLALGINMPCATVVFSGDSVFLTALNFRQAAGRAGRRGFDLLGNVVFQNMTTAKVCRLLSSRLPDLTGHFPVTTTLVLRLFTLLHESGDSKFAVDAINSLLSQPRLYLDGPAFKDQVLHHLRFSIEYLRRHDLLSAKGVPLNFAGLTSHLYYTENSSFALNALIKEGFFHELCADIDTAESRVLRDLMVVMAHLFGRRPCKHSDQEYIEDIVKTSPSVVFLPELPGSASRVLQQHNKQTLQIFSTYVQTFVEQHIHDVDNTLPLTGLSIGSSADSKDRATESDMSFLKPLLPTQIRSPFVALSGHGDDDFKSISDLCHTVRNGVFLEENAIPHLDVYPDEVATPLNAYLYDFYMHGDIEALERANGVRKSDVWFLLNDFSLVLATIQTSLANFMKIPDSGSGDMEDLIGGGDEGNNKDEDQFAAIDSGYGSATSSVQGDSPVTSTLPNRSGGGKKKKVEESWEEEADKDIEAEEWDDGESEDDEGPQTSAELEQGFLRIYKAVSKLKVEFDTKFRAMFA